MDQPGLSKVASYHHHQILQAEAPDTAAAIPTRTVNHKESMRTEVIPMDHPANKEDVLIRSPILIHKMTLIFLMDRKLEETTKPKRKSPITVISRIFIEAV
jgi:hypothetical protein